MCIAQRKSAAAFKTDKQIGVSTDASAFIRIRKRLVGSVRRRDFRI